MANWMGVARAAKTTTVWQSAELTGGRSHRRDAPTRGSRLLTLFLSLTLAGICPIAVANDAPFCVAGTAIGRVCAYYTASSCQVAARRDGGICVENEAAARGSDLSGYEAAGAAIGNLFRRSRPTPQAKNLPPGKGMSRGSDEVSTAVAHSRVKLRQWWEAYGLPPAEAAIVADAFQADDLQHAINARARRDGRDRTIDLAVDAYERRDFLKANQFLVAASLLE